MFKLDSSFYALVVNSILSVFLKVRSCLLFDRNELLFEHWLFLVIKNV